MSSVLITGANRGIGLEFCRQLSGRGASVVAVCRHTSPELEQLDVRVETGIDITDAAAGEELRGRLGDLSLDLLIHNAGLLEADSLESVEADSLRRQFEVNAVAPLLLTRSLLPLLHEGSKLVLITSRMGSIADNGSGGYYGYRMSKTALCMAGKSLAIDLAPRGIAVAILHPGMVSTRMTGFTSSGISPRTSVEGLLQRIDALTPASSGRFLHANGEELPW
ncbi:SDR family oxidoreductase [Cyanobium sp. CH-040]|uniref:SDR family oxidoreductase n=1 Tax=Cyanobium sp. CH-040 TaxID=2823708 RepID=UPI0020CCB4A1|nr:SDR family oxidoreductase [Cyanobium sp. CH-040]MCP9927765.1 SDR family oxidoreductase [Cyanobium sp. CH-040]